jgi:AcrR family transcriptional regulator
MQQRSNDLLDVLLDATASILDESGIEGLTTGVLAQRADVSIGSVYRYFNDRLSVLRALARRNIDRFMVRYTEDVLATAETYVDSIHGAIDTHVSMFRAEPGWRHIRFGDVLDPHISAGKVRVNAEFADIFATIGVERFGVENSPDLTLHLEIALELSDALLTRAFFEDPQGDERFIIACHDVVARYLSLQIGEP